MATGDIFLGDIPLVEKTAITANDSLLGLVDGEAKRILFTDVANIGSVDWNDLVNKPFKTIDTTKFDVVADGSGDPMLSLLAKYEAVDDVPALVTNVTALQTSNTALVTHTAVNGGVVPGVSGVTDADNFANVNLYKLANDIAGKAGHRVRSVEEKQSGGSTDEYPDIVADGSGYNPIDHYSWIGEIANKVGGNAPTSSGGSWSYTMNTDNAMTTPSNYIGSFKKYIFDNIWTANKSYAVGVVVIYNNNIYKCTTANSDGSFDSTHWSQISGGGGGGISGTPQEIWDATYESVFEGICRSLDVWDVWYGRGGYDPDTGNEHLDTYRYYDEEEGYHHYDSYDDNNLPQYTEGYISRENFRLKTKLLEMLTQLAQGYPEYKKIKKAVDDETYEYSESDLRSTMYGHYVYNTYQANDDPAYNATSDFMKALENSVGCRVCEVRGVFEADSWRVSHKFWETETYVKFCKLSSVTAPDDIPTPWDYEKYGHSDYNSDLESEEFIWYSNPFKFVAMTVDSADPDVIKEYNKIHLNSFTTGRLLSMPNYNYPETPNWEYTEGWMSADEDNPTVDIPIKFIIIV